MKPCDEYLLALSAFVDGELEETERAALEAHLNECEGCRRWLSELSAMRAAFDTLEEEPAPDGFAKGVMTRLQEQKRPARRRARGWMGLVACAAVALVALSVLPGLTGTNKNSDAAEEEPMLSAALPPDGAALAPEPTAANGFIGEERAAADGNEAPGATLQSSPADVPDEPKSVLLVYGAGAEEYLAAHAQERTYDADGEPAEYVLPPEELESRKEELDRLEIPYEDTCLTGRTFYVQIVSGGEAE